MTRVLVADDSRFFRRWIRDEINLDPSLTIVGEAANGKEAVAKTAELRPDLVTMDIEMPVMDGITAVKHIMKQTPVPIIMFSASSHAGAKSTLDALNYGAIDFLIKDFSHLNREKNSSVSNLLEKIHAVTAANDTNTGNFNLKTSSLPTGMGTEQGLQEKLADLIIIGSSTGGPRILEKILMSLGTGFEIPVVIIQHMPGVFTRALAERLNDKCNIRIKEAKDQEPLQQGTVYIAPGGKQLQIDDESSGYRLCISEPLRVTPYNPSIDFTMTSLRSSGPEKILAIILSGMGTDGCEGIRLLKKQKACTVWTQDKASSVVFGMPQSVIRAGLADKVFNTNQIIQTMNSL